jgi:hypothetical protein
MSEDDGSALSRSYEQDRLRGERLDRQRRVWRSRNSTPATSAKQPPPRPEDRREGEGAGGR